MSEYHAPHEDLTGDEAPLNVGKQRLDDDEMDITPMIDITFLLLIFFLVASKMDPNTAVDLPKARHGLGVVEKNSVVILIGVGTEEMALVRRADGKPFSDDVETQETEISQYIETSLEDASKEHILIKAEKGVRHGEVSRVAKAIGSVMEEGRTLNIAVMEVN